MMDSRSRWKLAQFSVFLGMDMTVALVPFLGSGVALMVSILAWRVMGWRWGLLELGASSLPSAYSSAVNLSAFVGSLHGLRIPLANGAVSPPPTSYGVAYGIGAGSIVAFQFLFIVWRLYRLSSRVTDRIPRRYMA